MCPLCGGRESGEFWRDATRQYLRCPECALVWVPSEFHLDDAAEKAEYDQHQNSPEDAGYRKFLGRLAAPLLERLPAESTGLDFGSGPGPTLSVILEEAGHRVDLYDVFYAPNQQVFAKSYDFITATEVVEHLAAPGRELARLWDMLRPGGTLAIMTKRARDAAAFASWHYKNDPTHIVFFAMQTFEWLARECGAHLTVVGSDVVFFERTP